MTRHRRRDRRPCARSSSATATACRSSDGTPVVSLGEGSTPLLRAPRALASGSASSSGSSGRARTRPGASRTAGMTVAVSKALEEGAQAVICASTGNTAASAAAYAARAGLAAVVLQPAGAVASAKLAQARALGARVLEVRGSFDEALAAARELADRGTHVLVNSLNPYRLEGQKTAAFEIVEELGGAPDVLALPYGGGGNTSRVRARLRRGRSAACRGSSPARRPSARRPSPRRSASPSPAHAATVGRGRRRVRRRRRVARRRGDPRGVARARARRGRLLRAVVGRRARGARARRARAGRARRLRRHRARAEGLRRPPSGSAPPPVVVDPDPTRSPRRRRDDVPCASARPRRTANLGPGFDCAAVALDLWNELEVTRGRRRGADLDHLGVRAFARLAPVGRPALRVRRPDPARARPRLERGRRSRSGSSRPRRDRGLGLPSRGAARRGRRARGPRRQPRRRARRRRLPHLGGDGSPASPTTRPPCPSRSSPRRPCRPPPRAPRCPASVPHADAAFTAGRAALLGAALASGAAELFAEALDDRLHEPYRAPARRCSTQVRERAARRRARRDDLRLRPDGDRVGARRRRPPPAPASSPTRFPDVDVLSLSVSPKGAHAL